MALRDYQRFGKYLILDHLVDGGMAKICRALYLGEQAGKIVAIKMIQEQFSKDKQFRTMFMDEIKVSFGLIHPNIAQTYEYGINQNQLFTSMEYVDGRNLKEFLDRLRKKNFVFPVEISVHIVSAVCQGLSYAHNFTDKLTGRKSNIIHRDISPHNIMLTYDGSVKIIDFGIAKAESNSEATQAGTIKGKMSYLAPEYLDGLTLDHRYDQFAVGIVLWELLCSRKLFKAPNDLAVLKLIQNCKIPKPSSINPNVSKELDQIVMKALSKDRNLRFENMDQFNRTLVKFLYKNYPDFNQTDLSFFAKELFKEEIKRDRAKMLEYGQIDTRPYLEDLKSEGSASGGDFLGRNENGVGRTVLEMDLEEIDKTSKNLVLEKKPSRSSGTRSNIAIKSRNLKGRTDGEERSVGGGKTSTKTRRIGGKEGTRTSVNRTATRSKAHQTQTRTRTQIKNGTLEASDSSKSGSGIAILALVGALAVFFFKPNLTEKYIGVNLPKMFGLAKTSGGQVAPIKNVPKVKKVGSLTLVGLDLLSEVYLNDRKINYTGVSIPVDFGTHKLTVTKEGHESFVTEFTISDSNMDASLSVPELRQLSYGAIRTARNFGVGYEMHLDLNGVKQVFKMPLSRAVRVPAGEHEAILKNSSLGTQKKIRFTVEEDQVLTIE